MEGGFNSKLLSNPWTDQDLIPKVFKPFYTTKAKGAGLGLAIVEKIIQEHRGKIEIFSECGKGTTVEVTLPASKE